MALRKCICLTVLLCASLVQPARTQDRQYTQLPNSEPFTISEGSSFAASGTSGVSRPASRNLRIQTIEADLQEAIEIISRNHASGSSLRRETLIDAAISSMLKTLDPHSNYYNAAEFQDLLGEHESEYSGTGSSIAGFERDGRIQTFIISTMPDSPASRAGLLFGDRIIAVNGRNVTTESPDVIRDLVRGKRGTGVRVTVERAETGHFETIEMKRDRVHEPAVPKGFMLKGNVGYIDLTNGFSNATFSEFDAAFKDLQRKGMSSLVLDLRGNGGGILEQAIRVAEKFLPPGSTIVSQKGRYANDNRTWKAAKEKYETMPLVVLVDEYTASASEVVVGALQDSDRALIVGEKTFGKGLVQSVLSLPDGGGLTLTAARYFTPTGRSIQRNYADTGLYDYFHHRQPVEIGTSVYVARTPTNRLMQGGDGIMPDEVSTQKLVSNERMPLLDPIFFFARDVLSLRGEGGSEKGRAALRQKIIFGEETVDDRLTKDFFEFAASDTDWSKKVSVLKRNDAFVRVMLRYYLETGAFGTESANKVKIEADPQIDQAIRLLPSSARLFTAAEKARQTVRKEKSSLSLVLNEQR